MGDFWRCQPLPTRADAGVNGELRVWGGRLEFLQSRPALAFDQDFSAPTPPSMSIKKLGRYDLIRVLGKGAMGLVYEARDPNLDRRVAIKTIRFDNLSPEEAADYEVRFRTEARSAARLQHPNIVSVYDSDRDQAMAYLVMEYVQGQDLKHHLDSGQVYTLEQTLGIMADLLAALDYAHRMNIVHRDIKPANLLMEANGRVKLTDFGVARIQDSGEATRTRGAMVGTLKYMSPEQVKGLQVDSRADIFSAGIVLHQLLTGKRAFDGDSDFAVIQQIVSNHPAAPSYFNPQLPPALDAVVARALAKSRDQRFATAQDFAAALQLASQQAADRTLAPPASVRASSTSATWSATVRPGESLLQTLPGQPGLAQEVELVYWKDIKDLNDAAEFELFLQKFPLGVYADLARRRLRKIEGLSNDESDVGVKSSSTDGAPPVPVAGAESSPLAGPAPPATGVQAPESPPEWPETRLEALPPIAEGPPSSMTSQPSVISQSFSQSGPAVFTPEPRPKTRAEASREARRGTRLKPNARRRPDPDTTAPLPSARNRPRKVMWLAGGVALLALAAGISQLPAARIGLTATSAPQNTSVASGSAPSSPAALVRASPAPAAASAGALAASATPAAATPTNAMKIPAALDPARALPPAQPARAGVAVPQPNSAGPALPSAPVAALTAASSPAMAASAAARAAAVKKAAADKERLAKKAADDARKSAAPAAAGAPEAGGPAVPAAAAPSAERSAQAASTAGGPRQACEDRVLIGFQMCMAAQCARPVFNAHPICVERRLFDQRQREAEQMRR